MINTKIDAQSAQSPSLKEGALYFHIPICARKCSYCDFYSVAQDSISITYLSSLIDKIATEFEEAYDKGFYFKPNTTFIGGGTPSLVPFSDLERLLKRITKKLSSPLAEFTIEVNPESLTEDLLHLFADYGINRVSMGAQSLSDKVLQAIGRKASAKDVFKAIDLLKKHWLQKGMKASVDTMGGLPLSTQETEFTTVKTLVDSGFQHLSYYNLIVEEETPLSAKLKKGLIKIPKDEDIEERNEKIRSFLATEGFERYEVSNYAKKGEYCAHNLHYWKLSDYAGFGPSAAGTSELLKLEEGLKGEIAALRTHHAKSIEAYMHASDYAVEIEELTRKDYAFETLMMGVRTSFGLNTQSFRARLGASLETVIPKTIEKWLTRSYASWEGDFFALTNEGFDMSNQFLVEAMIEWDS